MYRRDARETNEMEKKQEKGSRRQKMRLVKKERTNNQYTWVRCHWILRYLKKILLTVEILHEMDKFLGICNLQKFT